ncbi:udp-sugar pyrophosphorylase [Quercus suber]|uniref:Udp-sugar pyrophosphorylase n=1 Tax=Quercus suber TaxID=58331 RepID=A0AAW0KRX1_QUESU
MCPPKTCVYLEPLDKISLNNVADGWQMPMTMPFQSVKKTCLFQRKIISNVTFYKVASIVTKLKNRSFSQSTELLCGNLAFMENTQMWKEPESMIHRGKHPGENTLKLKQYPLVSFVIMPLWQYTAQNWIWPPVMMEVALHAETTTGTGFLQNYIESILALQDASCRLTQGFLLCKQRIKEIESFTYFLSKLLSSSKPWFSRFQKLLSNPVE